MPILLSEPSEIDWYIVKESRIRGNDQQDQCNIACTMTSSYMGSILREQSCGNGCEEGWILEESSLTTVRILLIRQTGASLASTPKHYLCNFLRGNILRGFVKKGGLANNMTSRAKGRAGLFRPFPSGTH